MTYLQKKFGVPTLVADSADQAPFDAVPAANQTLVPAHIEVAAKRYETLDVHIDPETRSYWCTMLPQGRGSFSPEMLRDMRDVQCSIKQMFTERAREPRQPFDYFVVNSRVPGTFNLGGDLGLFADKIRSGDREALREYAYTCIKVVHTSHISFDVPVVTLALVQGDALGGGFECALSMDMIVAERSAKLGLPEIMFNLFPGMGAYSLLSRRLDAARAEKMILSGRIYTAEELHEMGIVDILAEDGQGEEAVYEYIDKHAYRHNAYRAVFNARKRVNPVTYEELRDITDVWVEAAMGLSESDLRRMARLMAAQDRRRATQQSAAPVSALSAE